MFTIVLCSKLQICLQRLQIDEDYALKNDSSKLFSGDFPAPRAEIRNSSDYSIIMLQTSMRPLIKNSILSIL